MGWARYEAVVSNNADPDKLGRIQVVCDHLAGAGKTLPFWVEPAGFSSSRGRDDTTAAGWFGVPEKGSRVTIEVLEAHPTDRSRMESIVTNPVARYHPGPLSKLAPPGSDFTGAAYPSIRGYRSPSGHVLLFDDSAGAEAITVRHASGASYVRIDADGTMTLHAPHVKIDEAADTHLVRGEDLREWITAFIDQKYNMHIHPTGVGPSGPPTVPATTLPSSALSSNHKVK
jgi:hypothetical protein